MATHPKYATNGNANGNGKHESAPTVRKLYQLLAFHDNAARSLRLAIDLLTGGTGRADGGDPVLAAAVKLDAARRNGHDATPRKPSGQYSDDVAARRKQTAAFLDRFNAQTPTAIHDNSRRIGVVVQHGYLKKVRGGYLRTAKPFEP